MKTESESEYRPSRGDRAGIVVFMIAGIAIIAWSAFAAVARIYEVLLGEHIAVPVRFSDTTIAVPIGEAGSSISMTVDAATVSATHLTQAGFVAAIVASLLSFLIVSTIVVCLLMLAARSLRGEIFSRRNTRLVVTAGMTALVGFGLSSVVTGIVGAETLHSLGGDFTKTVLFVADPLPFVLFAFAFGIVATAYTVGAKMQRETAGLI